MSRSKWIALIGVMVLIGASIAMLSANRSNGGLVDSARFQELAAEGVRIVDVRTVAEFEGGHIPGAQSVPLTDIASAVGGWDSGEPIALYCATGGRSAEAATTLRGLGFKTVYDLSGGIAAWTGQIESGAPRVAEAQRSASGLPVMYEFYTDW